MNFAASTSQNAALSSSPQILTNFGHDDHLDAFSSVAYDTLRTILVTPLPSISTPSSIYTLYLDRTIQQHPFNNDHLDIVQDLLQAYTPKRP